MPEFSIGVDLGGTNLRAAAISKAARFWTALPVKRSLSEGRDAVISDIVEAIVTLRDRMPGSRFAASGSGCPASSRLRRG
jgi:glucokinase